MAPNIKTATLLANLLDNKFNFLGFRFGIDAILDLVPGIGDTIVLFLSLYIIYIAIKLKIPTINVIRMIFNVGISYIVGLIPFLGDAAYIFYKPNIRNLAILNQHIEAF